jgi:hypothetical protein
MSVKRTFIAKILENGILLGLEDVPMEFSPDLKTELKKAIKLSGFITSIVVGLILIQYRQHWMNEEAKRGIASVSAATDCRTENTQSDHAPMGQSGRAVPPFERRQCEPQR